MVSLGDLEHLEAILQGFERLDLEACYCSVFDECWTTSFHTFGEVQPVEACVRDETSFEE